jgi:hypothetical protein
VPGEGLEPPTFGLQNQWEAFRYFPLPSAQPMKIGGKLRI